jgi:hypothetical protein
MKKISLLIICSIVMINLYAQNYTQTVKGKITDKDSHTPVSFATVTISNSSFSVGVNADENGYFKIEEVPVGRMILEVFYLGYETITMNNLEVEAGKELILEIELTESIEQIEEVTVLASNNKEKPMNSYAGSSARTFSVEESKRYAGSSNDVSRMAMNFAGVKMSAETTNEIVIRGNSPVGLVFRLEGVDIPNPNHFGDAGTTGGVISLLNNNVLSNSDFLTGAFPAEYGNTLSGVFDLRMRNGNDEQFECIGQIGLMGIELGLEGPLFFSERSSFLLNYRYSTIQLLDALGLSPMGTAIPNYQDVSFKVNVPTKHAGNFSLFGIGGNSNMSFIESDRDTTEERQQMAYESDYEMDIHNDNYNGVIGLKHSYIFNSSAYSTFILSASGVWNYNLWDSLSTEDRTPVLQYYADYNRTKYSAKFNFNKKFNSKNTIRTGISIEQTDFTIIDSIYDGAIETHRVLRDFDGIDQLMNSFVQFKHRFNDNLHVNLGVHIPYQFSNQNVALEPRAGIVWEFLNGSSFHLAYGLHSLVTPVDVLNQNIYNLDGSYSTPNTELDFTKSHHLVFGYDKVFSNKFRLKSELYYQYIYNAVVEIEESSYSLLNRGAYEVYDTGALSNDGTGFNYGIEFTAEKFMDHGSYFLATISLFESKYKGSDGILRGTAFNSNYVVNLLGGKEFQIGTKKENKRYIKKLVIDGKINYAGGMRYTPVDIEASRTAQTTIYDESKPYQEQLPDYFRIDLRIAYKFSGKKTTQEIGFDVTNITNRQNAFDVKYDIENDETQYLSFGMMPNFLYRITF